MDLRHKHWAIISAGVLVAAFLLLAGWYIVGTRKAMAPDDGTTASSTPISTTAETKHYVEHSTYYDIDLTYPASTPLIGLGAAADARAVSEMKKYIEDAAAQFKKDGNFANLSHDDVQMMGLDQRKMAFTSEYKTYTGARTVSYVMQIYSDTFGAHPNTYFKTFTFDVKTGNEISLSDLFVTSVPYLQRVSARARADLPRIIKEMSGYEGDPTELDDGTSPAIENFQWFYIDNKNLVFIFPPYQVGPYALGTVIDTIPLGQLGDSLKTEYR